MNLVRDFLRGLTTSNVPPDERGDARYNGLGRGVKPAPAPTQDSVARRRVSDEQFYKAMTSPRGVFGRTYGDFFAENSGRSGRQNYISERPKSRVSSDLWGNTQREQDPDAARDYDYSTAIRDLSDDLGYEGDAQEFGREITQDGTWDELMERYARNKNYKVSTGSELQDEDEALHAQQDDLYRKVVALNEALAAAQEADKAIPGGAGNVNWDSEYRQDLNLLFGDSDTRTYAPETARVLREYGITGDVLQRFGVTADDLTSEGLQVDYEELKQLQAGEDNSATAFINAMLERAGNAEVPLVAAEGPVAPPEFDWTVGIGPSPSQEQLEYKNVLENAALLMLTTDPRIPDEERTAAVEELQHRYGFDRDSLYAALADMQQHSTSGLESAQGATWQQLLERGEVMSVDEFFGSLIEEGRNG